MAWRLSEPLENFKLHRRKSPHKHWNRIKTRSEGKYWIMLTRLNIIDYSSCARYCVRYWSWVMLKPCSKLRRQLQVLPSSGYLNPRCRKWKGGHLSPRQQQFTALFLTLLLHLQTCPRKDTILCFWPSYLLCSMVSWFCSPLVLSCQLLGRLFHCKIVCSFFHSFISHPHC